MPIKNVKNVRNVRKASNDEPTDLEILGTADLTVTLTKC